MVMSIINLMSVIVVSIITSYVSTLFLFKVKIKGGFSDHNYTRSLIEASLDPFVTISPEGKITDVNDAAIKVIGLPRDRFIGTDFSEYFTEPEVAQKGYQEAINEGQVKNYKLHLINNNSGAITPGAFPKSGSCYNNGFGRNCHLF